MKIYKSAPNPLIFGLITVPIPLHIAYIMMWPVWSMVYTPLQAYILTLLVGLFLFIFITSLPPLYIGFDSNLIVIKYLYTSPKKIERKNIYKISWGEMQSLRWLWKDGNFGIIVKEKGKYKFYRSGGLPIEALDYFKKCFSDFPIITEEVGQPFEKNYGVKMVNPFTGEVKPITENEVEELINNPWRLW